MNIMRTTCFLLIACFFIGCTTSAEENGFSKTASNFSYKIFPSASGAAISKGDVVKLHLQQYIDDSLMNDTRTGMPEYIKIDSTLREFDYSEILPSMKVDDSAVCLFATSEIIKRISPAASHPPHFLEDGKYIKVYFKVVDKFSKDSLAYADYKKEKENFEARLARQEKEGFDKAAKSFDSLINTAPHPLIKLPGNVYVHMQQQEGGNKIKKGDSVAVVYKGRLANGILFEEVQPAQPFVFRAGHNETVPGFDAGISSLSYGDKAVIYIPAPMAYGASKAGEQIPPFSNLVFEVSVSKK